MALTPVQRSALYTLAYTAQFEYPLTEEEVWFRTIAKLEPRRPVLTKPPTFPEVKKALLALKQKKLILQTGASFSLAGQPELLSVRRRRFQIAQTKWQEVKQTVGMLKHIPWIQAIFITGSLAMDNAEVDEDIDFMIITSPNRLWLTRLIVSALAWGRGKRRSWQGEEKRSWCFNLWLEETELDLFSHHPSLYVAYELIQARLVFDRNKVGERLMAANAWVKTFLPLATALRGKRLFAKKQSVHFLFSPDNSSAGIFDKLNQLAYRFQRWYMTPHKTRERVTKKYALFHPRDTQGWLYGRWQQALEGLV